MKRLNVILLEEQIQPLLVFLGAEGQRRQRLRLAAREERRAVHARQQSDFAGDLANFVERAAIRAALAVQDVVAENVLAQALKCALGELALLFVFFRNRFDDLGFHLIDQVVAFLLRMLLGVQRVVQFRAVFLLRSASQTLSSNGQRRHLHLLRLELRVQFAIAATIFFTCSWPNSSASTTVSSETSSAPDSTITMASSLPAITMFSRLVFCSATVGLATSWPSTSPTRTAAIGVGNGRSEIMPQPTRAVTAITSGSFSLSADKHHGYDLRFIAPGFRKQRAHRAVDQPRRQNFALRRAPFALEESSGNFSGRIRVFAIVHGQRQKISVVRLGVHASGDQNHRVAVARHNRAVGLLGNFSGFQRQRSSADFDRYLIRRGV